MKFMQVTFLVIFVSLATACSSLFLLSAREVGEIREEILVQTPLGATMDDVRRNCNRVKMICNEYSNTGYWDSGTNLAVGVKHISAALPDSRGELGFVTSQTALWAFDTNGTLIEVGIDQSTDSL